MVEVHRVSRRGKEIAVEQMNHAEVGQQGDDGDEGVRGGKIRNIRRT